MEEEKKERRENHKLRGHMKLDHNEVWRQAKMFERSGMSENELVVNDMEELKKYVDE
jgi:triphosphoribosyl-dephospho-CoA synthetase